MAKAPRRSPPIKKKPIKKAVKSRKPARPARTSTRERAPERLVKTGEVVDANPSGRAFPIEIDPRAVEETLNKVKGELLHWANKGRYTKVRFKFRGKQLLPDLPLAAVAAAEGLTFYWGGILRALLFNFAGKSVLSVELINDSEKKIQKGKDELLSGNLDAALSHFREAIAMDRDSASAHLNLGVALKLKGQASAARTALVKAKALAKEGPIAAEAERLLQTLPEESALTVASAVTSNAPPTAPN
ncbi:MAG: tetratricopeptide repeat protein [Myxococcaceae bacterium]